MARVLITGAAGGLGQTFKGVLSRKEATLEPAFPGPVEVVALTHAQLDISKRESMADAIQTHKPDVLLNCAGQTQVDYCETYQWEAFLANRDGAEHVARACATGGVLPVYLSTDLVFDGSKKLGYAEDDPPNPLGIFGDSKLAGELMTMKNSPRHLIVRSGWVYGQPGKHFLRVFEDGVQSGEILFGYDDQVAQPTYAPDHAEAVLKLIRTGQVGRYHVGSSGSTTQFGAMLKMRDLLAIRGVDFRPIHRSPGGRHAMRPRMSVLDTAKCAKLGITLRPWEEGLKDFAAQCREIHNAPSDAITKRRT